MSFNDLMVGKRVLVTGGAGFIGSHLVERLLHMNCEVVVLDNLSSGRLENLPLSCKGLSFIRGDVRDFALVKKVAKNADIVFHLAEFIPNTEQEGPGHVVKFSMRNPVADLDVSVKGTLNVLEAAKQAHAKVVFCSTAAVYGEVIENPIKETTPANPISPYGASKASAEIYCKLYSRVHNLPVIIARLFNVYGPKQRKYLMYDVLLKLDKNSHTLTMLGSGNQKRDFIFVDDVVEALVLLSTKGESYGDIFNVGTGVSTPIKKVVSCITKILGVKPNVIYTGSSWKGDINILTADITKLKKMGFTPKHSLVQGIKKFVKWYQKARKDSGNIAE